MKKVNTKQLSAIVFSIQNVKIIYENMIVIFKKIVACQRAQLLTHNSSWIKLIDSLWECNGLDGYGNYAGYDIAQAWIELVDLWTIGLYGLWNQIRK